MKNTFTYTVKEEILTLKFYKKDWKPLLIAYLKNSVTIALSNEGMKWEVASQVPKILRFIYDGISQFAHVDKEFFYTKQTNLNKSRIYKMIFFNNLEELDKKLKITNPDIDIKNDEQYLRALLIGFFLSAGSVNSPKSKTYHLEFRLRKKSLAECVKHCIDYFNLESKIRKHNDKYIVYVKKSEHISDILKLLNANDAMFVFEDERINKDYSNQVHRLNNLDISNLKKTVNASNKICEYINFVMEDKSLFAQLSSNEKQFCKTRLENPDWSLEEISSYFKTKLKINLSKSALNHYSRKIKKIYNSINGDLNDE